MTTIEDVTEYFEKSSRLQCEQALITVQHTIRLRDLYDRSWNTSPDPPKRGRKLGQKDTKPRKRSTRPQPAAHRADCPCKACNAMREQAARIVEENGPCITFGCTNYSGHDGACYDATGAILDGR